MARLNIKDDIDSRSEYKRLVRLLNGNDDQAMGMLVRFWRIAQKHWGKHELVPMSEIEIGDLQPIIESRWGIVRDGGVYAIGSENQFEWYQQRCDSSKAGGRARSSGKRDGNGRFVGSPAVNQPETIINAVITDVTPAGIHPESSPPSPSLIQIQKTKDISNELSLGADESSPQKKKRFTIEHSQKAREFVTAYVEAYQTKFKGRPEDLNDGKTKGQIMNWIKDYPLGRATQLIQVYFQLETKWFGTKGYDFITFRNNLNKVGQALDSGTDPDGNKVDWAKVFGGQ